MKDDTDRQIGPSAGKETAEMLRLKYRSIRIGGCERPRRNIWIVSRCRAG